MARNKVRTDLLGKKFLMLTVVELVEIDKCLRWKCLCDCGNITFLTTHCLITNHTRSCGCFRNKRVKEINWNGVGELSGRFFGNILCGAKARGIEFTLTKEDLWNQFIKQDRKCALSGVDLVIVSGKSRNETTASVDRIDGNKGYTVDNVQWVHKRVNLMKHTSSDSDFIEWCKIIAEHNKDII